MSRFWLWLQKKITSIDSSYHDVLVHKFNLILKEKLREKLQEGYKEGYENGYAECLQKEKKVLLIQGDTVPVKLKELDLGIYGPTRFEKDEQRSFHFFDKLSEAVKKGLVGSPTKDQIEMICCLNSAACIAAGAGSGKSTTLALRVIYMLMCLGVDEDSITVVSFTTASCDDIKTKLKRLFDHFGIIVRDKECKNLVRTYHSLLLNVFAGGRDSILGCDFKYFENIDDDKQRKSYGDNSYITRMSSAQITLLKQAYVELYKSSADFRKGIMDIVRLHFIRQALSTTQAAKKHQPIQKASQRDLTLVSRINEEILSRRELLTGIEGIEFKPIRFEVNGHAFYANGKIKGSNQLVYFSNRIFGNSFFSDKERIEGFSIVGAVSVKRNIVSMYRGGDDIYILNRADLENLKIYLMGSSLLTEECLKDGNLDIVAPEIRLKGDLSTQPLYMLFYQYASFIESMSMEVPYCLANMDAFHDSNSLEHVFSNLLSVYWRFFEEILSKERIITFNRGFLSFTKYNLASVNSSYLMKMQHLLIDEFQDISPQIVEFIIAAQTELRKREGHVSIMSIGDDWQSIYGWRGSSPLFFIGFKNFFPIFNSSRSFINIVLGVNFRSHDLIVQDAAKIVRAIKNKTDKETVSYRGAFPDEHGVIINYGYDFSNPTDVLYENFITLLKEQFNYAKNHHGADYKVLVLTRSGDLASNLFNAAKSFIEWKGKEIGFMTCHRAKGLQSIVTIVCDDFFNHEENVMKSNIYTASPHFSGLETTFSQIEEDELKRLAYVAVTRGIRRVHCLCTEDSYLKKLLR